MARQHGLRWMVATDHGGPTHSKLNRDEAYPELLQSRSAVPEVLQFYGMELNLPDAEDLSDAGLHGHIKRYQWRYE